MFRTTYDQLRVVFGLATRYIMLWTRMLFRAPTQVLDLMMTPLAALLLALLELDVMMTPPEQRQQQRS